MTIYLLLTIVLFFQKSFIFKEMKMYESSHFFIENIQRIHARLLKIHTDSVQRVIVRIVHRIFPS